MPERKVWTGEEDRILKLLIEERGFRRWSQISKVMEEEFKVTGRNGKQCRQRYHNHLDRNITTSEWSPQQDELLFTLQDEVGNKWTLISSKLPGRADNCVKNHFYSKLRKSLRSINKKIHKFMKKDYRQIKTNTLYRIIETLQNRNRNAPVQNDTFALCRKIKNHLYRYDCQVELDNSQELHLARTIIEDIALFDKDVRKPKRANLQSSAKLSEGSKAKAAESTRSIYDDESQCSNSNNSSLFSSSSFDHRSLCGSQRLLPPSLVFRSQSIQSESEIDSQGEIKQQQVLYKSANSPIKTQRMPPIQPIQQESAKRESSKNSHSSHSHSSRSHKSQKSDEPDSNGHYMFGQESLEMRVVSPQQLTFREKLQIREESNDLLFYGQMEIEDDSIVKGLSQMSLQTIPNIPKLGKYTF